MTTGPEHYREAERLLDLASNALVEDHTVRANYCLAEAQVHATLALAAATALNDHDPNGEGMPVADFRAWRETVSVEAEQKQPCPRCHCIRNCECDMTIPDEGPESGPDCTCGGGPVHQLHCDAPGED